MATGSLIFKTRTLNKLTNDYNNKLWYFDALEPLNSDKTNYKTAHYIDIFSEFENLEEMILWCKENDDKCRIIAENSFTFYEKYLNEKSILDYLELTVNKISKNIQNHSVIEDVFEEIIREPYIRKEITFPNDKLRFLIGSKGKNIDKIKRSKIVLSN